MSATKNGTVILAKVHVGSIQGSQEYLYATYCSAVAFSGENIFVEAPEDHFAAQGAVYRRTLDSQVPFDPIRAGLPTWMDGFVDSNCMEVSNSALAIAGKGGDLYICAGVKCALSRCLERVSAPSSRLISERHTLVLCPFARKPCNKRLSSVSPPLLDPTSCYRRTSRLGQASMHWEGHLSKPKIPH